MPALLLIFNALSFNRWRLCITVILIAIYLVAYIIYLAPLGAALGGLIVFVLLTNLKAKYYEPLFIIIINIFAIVFFIGIVLYALYITSIFDYISIIKPINPLKIEKGIYFKDVYFFLKVTSTQYGDLYRFQSIFDEPGVVGTITGIAIIAMNGDVKYKWQRYIFIASGILSLSTAFFVFYFISILITYSYKKALYTTCTLSVTIIILYNVIPQTTFDVIQPIVEYKLSAGDNRVSDCFKSSFDRNMPNNFLFGLGKGATLGLGCDISSFVASIYDYGYLGLLIIFLLVALGYLSMFYGILGSKMFKNDIVIYIIWLIILVLNFYQRPDFFHPLLLIFGAGFYINRKRALIRKL
ncbi:hypothetical protein ACE02D_07430 [Shewanella bicestrii]|uniref:hypothetical protein n=1 Tax=Aeromonas caviae TaxID=648 RepID=UPI002B474B79|nr:hypothetical protein [Aeromonas caviae]